MREIDSWLNSNQFVGANLGDIKNAVLICWSEKNCGLKGCRLPKNVTVRVQLGD
jgi:hypothetical protein